MHLLLAQKGEIADAGEAVDLGQTPADIVFLSAADTQLTALATAQKVLNDDKSTLEPSLRLANLMQLAHPMSLDLYIDRTARHAKLIIVQLLGGRSYSPSCPGMTSLILNWHNSQPSPLQHLNNYGIICAMGGEIMPRIFSNFVPSCSDAARHRLPRSRC